MTLLSHFRSDGGQPKNWVRNALIVLISLAIGVMTFEKIVDPDQFANKEDVVVCNVVGGCNPTPVLFESAITLLLVGAVVAVVTWCVAYW